MSNTENNRPTSIEDSGEISINFGEIFRALNKFKLTTAILLAQMNFLLNSTASENPNITKMDNKNS